MQEDAIKRLRVEATESGITETTQKVGQLTKAEVDLETAQLRRASAQVQLTNAQNRQMIQYQQMLLVQQRFTASNDNIANSTNHIGDVLRSSAKAAIDYSASWLATAGAVGAGLLVLGRVISVLTPIILAYKAIKDAIGLVTEAWELGGKKLEEYRQIAEKAAAVDLSTSFFQKITKSATDAKLPIDALTESFKNLEKVSADKLGGSDLKNRLDQLTEAGNFKGNTGISQLAQANTTEEKFRAIVSLVDQAMTKGERLAALDLTSKFLSPAAQAALAKNSDYLTSMLAAADKLSGTDIVSDADVGRALDLQRRYDAAVAILEQRWHPVQDLLTAAGIKMQSAWVGIVEAVATAVDWVVKLVMKIGEIPTAFWDFAKRGSAASVSVVAGAIPVVGPVVSAGIRAAANSEADVKTTDDYASAVNRLAAGLKNTNAVQQAAAQTNAVQAGVWKDTSHAIEDAAKEVAEVRDQYDRAKDAIEKHTSRMIADKDAIGLGVGAHEEFRAKAQLTTAAIQAGIPITAALTAEIDRLAKAAGASGQNLAVAAAENKANFDLATVGLSGVEKQIAQVNFQLYGNKWKDYADSAIANTMRITSAIQEARDAGQDFAKSFVQGILSGKSAMDALVNAAQQLASKMADKAIVDLFSGNFAQAGIEGAIAIGSAIFAGDQKNKKELKDAQDAWAKMTDQVRAFNAAAAGVDFGPLTQEVQSLFATFQTLAEAAHKARDEVGLDKLSETRNEGISRVVAEFGQGSLQVLSPLQDAIKKVKDEAEGLKSTIDSAGQFGVDGLIDAGVKAHIKALMAQYTDALTSGLTERLNSAQGKGYLNDAAALLKQRQADLVNAADLGNNPTILAQISATFAAGAQKIIEDAGLVGSSFDDFIKLFPDFNGVVTQSATAIEAANEKFAALTKTITDYLNSLAVGSNSILSPEDQLGAAQSAFNRQLGLAQGGDEAAQGSITSYASTLLDQAKSYYASSSGYADIYRAVTSALGGLVGLGSQASAPGISTPSPISTGSLAGIVPQVSLSGVVGSNDNAAVAAQTQSLSQVFAQVGNAQIINLNDRFAELRADVKQLTAAVKEKRALRPSDRAA